MWSTAQADEWSHQQGWLVGYNLLPHQYVNSTEMWQEETFDVDLIDWELSIAEDLGFNTLRVFLPYLVWKSDPDGLLRRLSQLLDCADRHGQKVMPVLLDDCKFSGAEPYLGAQQPSQPGKILSSWTPSPGHDVVRDPQQWPAVEDYVRSVVSNFADDPRIVVWDIYNEPGNFGLEDETIPLLRRAFAAARQAGPRQPLTAGAWKTPAFTTGFDQAALQLSDVVSFHCYENLDATRAAISTLRALERPLLCTEWMARPRHSLFGTHLPLFRQEGVGCYSWGLVNGRAQTQFAWDTPGDGDEPDPWFHDVAHPDGTPYDAVEWDQIRRETATARGERASR